MMAVGDDEHIGGGRDGAKQHGAQSGGQSGRQGTPRGSRKVGGMNRHGAPPRSRCRLVVERNPHQATTQKPKPLSPDFLRKNQKEAGANGSRGDETNASGMQLQQAGFSERERAALADDEVIQHPDVDRGQRARQPLGDRTIGG